jgi:glycosyltransferase involved in cell wall biosynthesis
MTDKVVWVINQFAGTPESGWGERHFYFAKYWREQGYQVRIISGSYNHMFKKKQDVEGLYTHEIYDEIDFFWVKTPVYNPQSVKRFLSMLIFSYRVLLLPIAKLGKPDVVIVSSMPIFPIFSGWRLKKKYKAKLIFEIRDLWPLTLQLLGGYSSKHPAVKFIGWFEKLGYRKSDLVVSLLPNAKQHIEDIANKEINFHYIPNGIDQAILEHESLQEDLIKDLPKNKFVIGYAGTLGLANALEYFVEAANELSSNSNIGFVIVGDGYLKDTLEEKSKNNPNIVFLPKIRKNQVQHLLTFFDVCFVNKTLGWN